MADMADRADDLAEQAQNLVPPAAEPENSVLPDNARIVRWAGPAFALFFLVMIPWTIYLGYTLPARQESSHYNIAWAGFDVLLLAELGATGWFAYRRSRYLAVAAASAATLLVTDAWFDIMTSPAGADLAEAIVMAVLAELPLAGVCWWLSIHTEHLEEQRIVLLLRRPGRPPAPADARRASGGDSPASGTRGRGR